MSLLTKGRGPRPVLLWTNVPMTPRCPKSYPFPFYVTMGRTVLRCTRATALSSGRLLVTIPILKSVSSLTCLSVVTRCVGKSVTAAALLAIAVVARVLDGSATSYPLRG